MSSAFFPSYKPQVLSRQEGFHLPSPAPSHNPPSPPSSNGTPSNAAANFDPNNLFLPPFLSIPDPFRKFPASADTAAGMDFTDELASLINSEHQSSERSTQNGASHNGNPYEEYRPPTHNIFDISAPTSHHHHSAHSHSQSFHPQSPFSLGSSNNPNGNNNQQQQAPEFAHGNFNSTLPALGSSMRYEPPPAPHSPFSLSHSQHSQGLAHPLGTPGAEPSSVSSFSSHLSSLSFSTAGNTPGQGDLLGHPGGQRQTPSPVSVASPTEFSRSRSRSTTRQSQSAQQQGEPPSTNGGPARRTRAKRGSVSSVSPPPLHRGHTQPLIIPGNNIGGMGGVNGMNGRGPASPLGLHGSGWFVPGGQGEFSLPTPDSVHGGFSAFTGASSLPANGLGVSPKDVSSAAGALGKSLNLPGLAGAGGESPPGADLATKQALIASEKRRRRRESHNAVERRRRDNINEKISELATLIPECLLDPNATMTMPASLSASSDDLLFGGAPGPSASAAAVNGANLDAAGAKKEEKDGSAERDDKDGQDGNAAAVKANKGMILKKSVEYIRYLQQLVSAQASRNRELEQQLQSFRSSSVPSSDLDDGALVLHEEVAEDFTLFGSPSPAAHSAPAHRHANGKRKKFSRGELASVEEMDMDDDADVDMQDGDGEETEKSSPSAMGEEEDEGEGEREEELRGRKGRDGRPAGLKERVKLEENGEMETS
ncbi:HLH-domain-containing protein [Rhodofomes roseus]|uniref:HLH-domain-containing protein n=1 Tax=Rhodofomes roseus TaxID=34475 RepID=A0ABQ8KD81_9APHY|nr:HLH-domain-containing protein [Rhodofomes roseus]KAH9835445.1 HLH-domain-containing protein [Rhodofomes roseus]